MHWIDELVALRTATNQRIGATRLVQALVNRQPAGDGYARYLLDVRAYAVHSPTVIGLAGARAAQTNRAVGSYLLHHATEEVGHEDWAAADLRSLGFSDGDIEAHDPSLACQSMIALEYYWANVANPLSIIGWMFTLEALGDDMGHFIAAAVEARTQGASTFVGQHGTADHDHIADIIDTLSKHVVSERDRTDVMRAARLSSDLYVGIVRTASEEP